jgi:hypothetical protein
MIQKIFLAIWVLIILIVCFLVFGISVMGDRRCNVNLKNSIQDTLIIMTINSKGKGWNMLVDSINLKPNEKLVIGRCIRCNTLKESDFNFDAIEIIGNKEESALIHKKDLPDYLNTLKRVECATFEIR